MNRICCLGLLAVLAMTTSLLRADALASPPPVAPPPAEQPSVSIPVEITYAKPNGNTAAKVVIPVALLGTLSQAKTHKSLSLPLGPEPGQPTSGFPHSGTIIAGLAISLAMVSMVYLVRRKSSQKWAVTGATVVLLGLGVTTYLWADIKVPGRPYTGPARNPNLERVPMPQPVGPMVTVEIVEKGDKILITVPPQGP
jgi:hypothetical protein